MQQPALPRFETYGWPHFVRLGGEEGRRWVDEEYAPRLPLSELSMEALFLMRTHRLEEGHERLERLREARERLADADPALRCVADRWYYAALGYYFYRRDEIEQADRSMARAREAVAGAVQRHRFLVPMAYDCYGFSLHRAEVARNGWLWDRMWRHLDEVRGMMEGRLPFCTLADGTPIGIAEIQAFYRSLPPLAAEERAAVADVLDDVLRLEITRSRLQKVFRRVPGMVIPYP